MSDPLLAHENRGAAGDLAAGEIRPAALMSSTAIHFYEENIRTAFHIPEGILIVQQMNDPKNPALSIDEAIVAPGVTTALHSLSVDECYVILSGQGKMQLDEVLADVGPGDVVQIPHGVRQRITNTSREMLRFKTICTPRFVPSDFTFHEAAIVPYETAATLTPGEVLNRRSTRAEKMLVSGGMVRIELRGEARDLLPGELIEIAADTDVLFKATGATSVVLHRWT